MRGSRTAGQREDDPRVVVAGVGRSGTSLIQAMMHAHPNVSFLPETHFFRRYVGPTFVNAWWSIRGARSFADRLEGDREFRRAGLGVGEVMSPFLSNGGPFRPHKAYVRLLELHRQREAVTIVGDKDPRLIDYLPALARRVPRVRVIHVIRDPRDVLVSRRKASWSKGRRDVSHLVAYRAQMVRGRKTGREWLGDGYLEVRYEDLLRNPRESLTRMCQHIGVEYDPEMMSFGQKAEELVAEAEWEWKKETTGPLKRDNIGNWKDELTQHTRRVAERVCVAPFPDLGYHRDGADSPGGIDLWSRLRAEGMAVLAELVTRVYPLRTLLG